MDRDFSMGNANADNMADSYFLIGLINRFNNSFQAVADTLFDELSWKQVFFLNCVAMFPQPPTIKEMADLLGCSHQNATQILSKLENQRYVQTKQDAIDKRKQRIVLTEKALAFKRKYEEPSEQAMRQLFQDVPGAQLSDTIKTFTRLIVNVDRLKGETK